MKLTLILPKCYDRREDEGDTLVLPPLTLATIAAMTPPHWSVRIIDDRVEKIDFDEGVDLVGISCIIETAGRAYDIAGQFRKRGVSVILGGIHPTLMPEDSLRHADSICCGDVYGMWDKVLRDFEQGKLQRIYRNMQPDDLSNIPPPRFDLLTRRSRYVRGVRLVNATRGCHMRCTFCSTQEFWKGTFHCRPVKDIVTEIKGGKERFVVFVDDDIGGNRKYVRELFKALIPLKIYWVSQTRINLCLDDDLLSLAARSGCIALFTGFESISMETLRVMQKHQNVVDKYQSAIEKCHKHRICIEAGFVFGFDTDNRSVFQDTLRVILNSKLDSININVLHPIPGTTAYDQLNRENRILTHNWNEWASHDRCLFRPMLMRAEEMEAGSAWVASEIYRWPRIFKRVIRSFRWSRWFVPYYLLYQNLSYRRRRVNRWKNGYNPAAVFAPEKEKDKLLNEDRSLSPL